MAKSIFETIENGDTITAEIIAEDGWGAALGNGYDMSGVDECGYDTELPTAYREFYERKF